MEKSKKPARLAWQTLDRVNHKPKSSDWFWAVGIVAVGAIILCVYFGNILLGIIFAIFAFTASIAVNKKPELHDIEISRKGVRLGIVLYPYSTLVSFWVEDGEFEDKILFKTRKSVRDLLEVPFDSTVTDPELIRDYLLDYLDEEEIEESLHQRLMEYLGF